MVLHYSDCKKFLDEFRRGKHCFLETQYSFLLNEIVEAHTDMSQLQEGDTCVSVECRIIEDIAAMYRKDTTQVHDDLIERIMKRKRAL